LKARETRIGTVPLVAIWTFMVAWVWSLFRHCGDRVVGYVDAIGIEEPAAGEVAMRRRCSGEGGDGRQK
jgi:hypothetical protein